MAKMLAQIGNLFRLAEEQFGVAAVGAGIVARHSFGNEREAATQLRGVIVAVIADIAARQHGAFRPRRADAFVIRRQFLQRVLRQFTVGGELTAKYRQQGRLTVHVMNIKRIVTGDGLR